MKQTSENITGLFYIEFLQIDPFHLNPLTLNLLRKGGGDLCFCSKKVGQVPGSAIFVLEENHFITS